MDDLLLYRLLREGHDDERLAGLLGEASRLVAAERAAFLGWLAGPGGSGEPGDAARTASLGCLAGCEGTDAVASMVAALDDDDEGRRAAGLEALRQLAARQPMRWVHAAFHRDVRVRRAALAGAAPEEAASMSLALVADEACRDLVLARFVPGATGADGQGAWPLPSNGVRLLLQMIDEALVDTDTVRALLLRMGVEELRPLLVGGHSRGDAQVRDWLAGAARAAGRPEEPAGGQDDLDRLVGLLGVPSASEAPDERKARCSLLGRLVPAGLFRDEGASERMAVALLAGRDELPAELMELLVEVYPAALTFVWLPRQARRAALRVYYQRGGSMARVERETLEALLESDLVEHAEGGLDLWAIGAVLHLAQGAPYERLLGWVSEASLVEAILARIDEAMPFLSLEDRSSRGTAHLLDLLRRRCPERSAWLTALWALTAPLDQLGALGLRTASEEDEQARLAAKREARKARKAGLPPVPVPPARAVEPITPAEAVTLLGELLSVERQGRPLGGARTERLGQVLGECLRGCTQGHPGDRKAARKPAPGGGAVARSLLEAFVAVWLGDGSSEPAALGVQTLVALVQPLDGDAFAGLIAPLDVRWLVRLLPALSHCTTLPFAKERALALALARHGDERVRSWSRDRLPAEQAPPGPSLDGRPLLEAERMAVRDCPESALAARLTALGVLRRGLVPAMLERSGMAVASVEVCVALLASDDAPGEVDRALGRWGRDDAGWSAQLHNAVVQRLNSASALPTLALAWLHLWERHAFALLDRLTADGVTLVEGASPVLGATATPWVRARLLEALGRTVGLLAYRDHERLRRVVTPPLLDLFVAELMGPAGLAAAEALVFLDRSRAITELVASVRPAVERLLPDVADAVRERLGSWIEVRGLGPVVARAPAPVGVAVSLDQIARCEDLEQLKRWCQQGTRSVVEEATLRLLSLGESGEHTLGLVLAHGTDRARLRPVLDTLDLWTDPGALFFARSLIDPKLSSPPPTPPSLRSGGEHRRTAAPVGRAANSDGERRTADDGPCPADDDPCPADDGPCPADDVRRSARRASDDWPSDAGDAPLLSEAKGGSGGACERALPDEVRFALALAWVERGDGTALAAAIEATQGPGNWFGLDDWARLVKLHPDALELSVSLAGSPQPHAYRESVEELLRRADATETAARVEAGLVTFLEAGTGRLQSLRRRAAQWLARRGCWEAWPVLLVACAEGSNEAWRVLEHARAPDVTAATRGLLRLGTAAAEQALVAMLEKAPVAERGEALALLIDQARLDDTRRAAVKLVESFPHRAQKLDQVAATFAWGVHRGRELLGGHYKVEMVDGQGLGYTRLHEQRIFVSPLPILRREQQGRTLVEALILHELGHHRYHRGAEADACWKAAEKEGIQRLYNLVLDEHLERNLRALDESFGDRLKLLTAYAFQHSTRSVPVAQLLGALGTRAAHVLPSTRLRVARDPGQVVVDSGPLLGALERRGLSFARFLRALRMGLGNRHGDERVSEGLGLFRAGFRRQGPAALLEVTRALQRIFGAETQLLGCTGSHESLTDDASEGIAHGDALSAAEVDEEVERIINPKKRPPGKQDDERPSRARPWLNATPDAQFSEIRSVVPVVRDRPAADLLARQVRRQALHLRRFLTDLGLARVPERRRLQGQRFDPSRAQAMVIRQDPRVLVARRLEVRSDLFLGVVVDCSGSMQSGGRIERARLFAALLAEAAVGLPGIELRVFGFTDQVIYDAGDAGSCAAHALVAGGGNNDAAALWHAAQVARQSRRQSRLLVMISDGLPTECSVMALRSLVRHLGQRERMVCAQVAVAKLAEECFPHHVLLDTANTDEAVQRFGHLVGTLVRRSLSAA